MAGTGKKWLVGCGIGCGAMILVTALGGTFLFNAFKGVEKDIEAINASAEALEDEHGDRFAFVPPIDGAIPADRMEIFLTVRDASLVSAEQLSNIVEDLESDDIGWLKKSLKMKDLVPAMTSFGSERIETMLELGMGAGEYEYIYALAYFNILSNDPSDGPSFMMNDSNDDSENHVEFRMGNNSDEDILEERSERMRNYYNEGQRAMLENQIEAYRATLPSDADWTEEEWGAKLLAEKNALELESVRMLWEDGLPDHIRNSFMPYQERLAATYYPLINPIEVGLSDAD